MRALKAISRADVAVLVLDAHDGLTAQDAHVAGYVIEEGKGLVIAVNKWDIVEDKTHKSFDDLVIDAPPRARVHRLRADRVDPRQDRPARPEGAGAGGRRVGRAAPADLDRRAQPARRDGDRADAARRWSTGKRPKIRYATQAGVAPPTFVFFATDPAHVHFSYRRYLENRLRDAYEFNGTPIRLVFREQVREKRPKGRGGKRRA